MLQVKYKHMNIYKIILATVAFIFFIVASPAYAATEITTIAGIPENASAAELIVYFFNLAVAVGAFIAVVIIIMAGIEWMTSDGNPSKIESAKDKIKNTLLGVAILIGCYLILDVINPELKNIKINKLYCSNGIAVMAKTKINDKESTTQTCVTKTSPNLTKEIGEITSTIDWNFLPDTILKVYAFSGENYTGTKKEFSCENGGCSGNFGDISGAKSIYFLLKNSGMYLFNQPNFSFEGKFPYFTGSSIINLAVVDFDNLASSIKIVDPDPTKDKYAYQGIVFDGPNYTGKCSFLAQSVPNLGTSLGGFYPTNIGNGSLSSMIVARVSLDQNVINSEYTGTVTLYNKPDCDSTQSAEVKSCSIRSFGQQALPSNCDFDVMSLSITGRYGVVLISNAGQCAYYDIYTMDKGVCQSSLPTYIYNPLGTKTSSIIIFPVEKR